MFTESNKEINFAIKNSKEVLIKSTVYCDVVEELFLSLMQAPFDEEYMQINWKNDISCFIERQYAQLNEFYEKEM